MPWTSEDYPASMRNLSKVTRAKAIEIATALLAESTQTRPSGFSRAVRRSAPAFSRFASMKIL